jgi:hypothetical protein
VSKNPKGDPEKWVPVFQKGNPRLESVTASRGELGLRIDKSYALTDSILSLRGRFAWAHDFNPGSSIAATFHALPGAAFVINGAAQARDAALTTASAEVLNGVSLAAPSCTVVGALRLTAGAHDNRNDRRADGAAGRLRDSRHGHHAAPLHVRSLDRARVSSGLRVCISQDLWRQPRWHVRRRDSRAYGGDGRREDNPHGRHG